jgi:chromosome segregation ATPase
MPIPGPHSAAERGNTSCGYLFCILAGLLVLGHPAPLKADTLTLNSGEVLEGQILSETETQIEIEASFYHGTIFSTRQVNKSDIRSIVRESVVQRQEKAAYASLTNYTLNPNQELTKDQYAAGIAALEKFQAKYTNSTFAAEISKRLEDWRVEASNVSSGRVKFAGTWMAPEEKKVQAEHAQKQAEAQAAQNALQSLKSQLADLQGQRAQLAATIATTQAKLTAAQTKLPTLPDTTGSASGTAASSGGGRRDLAGRLTAGVAPPRQEEVTTGQSPVPNPEKSQLKSDITLYQQQISQGQGTLASLDTKIKDVQTQIPQREQESKLAVAGLSETPAQSKPAAAQNSPAKDTHPNKTPPPPVPEPTPPWYTRVWNWFHR